MVWRTNVQFDIPREDTAVGPLLTTPRVQHLKKEITILSLPAAEKQLPDKVVTPLTQLPPIWHIILLYYKLQLIFLILDFNFIM